MGVDNLLEMVALTAEVGELKANPNRAASGAVIEARLDKGRGPIATLLVQNGTLHQGDIIIAGTAVGRVRMMTNDKGQKLTSAGPSVPVEITGLGEVPARGRRTSTPSPTSSLARELVEQRRGRRKRPRPTSPSPRSRWMTCSARSQEGEMKNLNIIVKADVQGSVEAVKAVAGEDLQRRGPRARHPRRASARSTRATSCSPPPRTPSSSASTSVPTRRPATARPSAQRRYADVPRHLRRHQRDRGGHEGYARAQIPRERHRPRRDPPDLQGVQRRHRRRLLRHRRQDPRAPARSRIVRDGIVIHEGRSRLPPALQGRRQGGRLRATSAA